MVIGVQITSIIFVTIFICFGVLLGLARPHAEISIRQYKYILIFIGILLVVFVYCFEPNNHIRWDLLEHYREVEAMRGKSFADAFSNSGYSGIFSIFVMYYYIICRVGNNQLLPVFPVLIDYLVFCYIFLTSARRKLGDLKNIPVSEAMLSTFFWFSTVGIKLAVSGMRCVLAASIVSLAVYLYITAEKKNIIKLVVLLVIASLIHSFALIVLLIALISIVKYKKTVFVAMLVFSSTGINLFQKLLPIISSSNAYLFYSTEKIVRYWQSFSLHDIYAQSGLGIVTVYICMIVLSLFLFIYSQCAAKKANDKITKNITKYCSAVAVVALGLSPNYLFIERLMYLESFAFTMLTATCMYKSKSMKILWLVIIPIFAWVFLNNDITTFIVNYTR